MDFKAIFKLTFNFSGQDLMNYDLKIERKPKLVHLSSLRPQRRPSCVISHKIV
jgi:hypothetical protein